MHPSTHQGATNTGAPRNTRNGNGQPGDSQNRTSRSTNYTDADGALASQSEFISQSADTSWSFSQSSVPQAGENISYQQPQSVSSSSMIGPPSAFYNAEDATQHHVDNSQQYQQWVDAYGSQHQQTAYSTQPNYNQGVSQSSGPLPDHYALVRGQYAAPRNQGQFGESLVGAMGQPSTSANVDTRYRQQQQAPASQPNSNLYDYISQGGSVGGNSGSTLTFQQYRPQQETEQQPRPIRQMRQAQQFQVPRQNPSQAQLQVPPPRGQRQVQPQQRERDSQAQQGQTQSQSRSPFSTGELAQSYSSELLPVGGAKPQSRSSGQSVSPSSWDDLVFSSRGSSAEAPIPTTGVAASSSSTSRLAQAGASTSKRPMPAKSSPQHSPPTKATGPPDRQGGNRASKRKRPKKNPDAGFVSEGLVEISDSESDDDAIFGSGMVSISVGTGGLGVEGSGRVQRP
ncbi:hypothetical protein BDN72DRAFT_896007 [Pluteus cervinus]|uniref:Uncharacterized protein n=1 Tax=Pluteus cervinus TaxID=181527 RepID=A0ACD3AZK6_9AGAR|nr:hypothetical protein BDN72DRAFT_896007 [Pluteus cervinus]